MKTVLGAILMAIGILVAGTAGLCAAILFAMGNQSGMGLHGDDILIVAMWIGGPMLIGAGLFTLGLYLVRNRNRD